MKFPIRLQEILKERGLKQADLCRMTGFSTAKVSKYITGQSTPVLDAAILIAETLGVTLDELVGRTLDEKPPTQSLECTDEEVDLVKKYRAIDERGKRTVRRLLNAEYEDAMTAQSKET